MKLTAIFDIGKTNKKFFLFDHHYQVIDSAYTIIEEIEDEDGFPCDNLKEIDQWLKACLKKSLEHDSYDIRTLNFSTYGASLVHIGRDGQPVCPLYNYLKPMEEEILQGFYQKYGDELKISRETASPPLAMLNSGLQLYWLKYAKPEVFKKIRWSLHLPQYVSFLFTGIPMSDFTSIGCHTYLWDYEKKDYHQWVYQEELDRVLPPARKTGTSINMDYEGYPLKIGIGIHDSSSALLPYISAVKKPFLLISTGTWSINMNPFGDPLLTEEELKNDCLNFMRIDGETVKASRLFLGNEYAFQVGQLNKYFDKEEDYHKHIQFNQGLYHELKAGFKHYFSFKRIHHHRNQPTENRLSSFISYEKAYHQLMMELVDLQIEATDRAIGKTPISNIFIDGGFVDNELYINLLALKYRKKKLWTTKAPLGSALGAAIVISRKGVGKKFLEDHYKLKRIKLPSSTK